MSTWRTSLPTDRPGTGNPASRARRFFRSIASLSPALVVALVAWPHLGDAARGLGDLIRSGGREPPLIRAPQQPIKVTASTRGSDQPADPVRAMLDDRQGWIADVELLPEPEHPILVPPSERGVATTEPPEQETAVAAAAPPPAAEPALDPSSRTRLELEPPPPLVKRRRSAPPDGATVATSSLEIVRASVSGEDDNRGEVYRIQIAAMPSRAAADEVWQAQRAAHPHLLAGLRPVIEHVATGSHTFFRVQAGELTTLIRAKELCEALQQRDVDCVVVRR